MMLVAVCWLCMLLFAIVEPQVEAIAPSALVAVKRPLELPPPSNHRSSEVIGTARQIEQVLAQIRSEHARLVSERARVATKQVQIAARIMARKDDKTRG